MLSVEARRAASILHQTPGWRWRRKLCQTERSKQRQSGPWWTAWFHDRCYRVDRDACRRGNVATRVRDTVRAPARSSAKGWRETLAGEATLDACVAHRLGTCGEHCQPELHGKGGGRVQVAPPERDPRGSGQHCFKELDRQRSCTPRDMRAAPLGDAQMASSGRVWVAPPGSDTWTSADSPIEAGPSYRSCTASPQRRRGVTVPSLIDTICEL